MLCGTCNITSMESLSTACVTKAQWDVWRLLPSPSLVPCCAKTSSYVISLAFCASPLVFPDHAAPLAAGLSTEVLTPGDSPAGQVPGRNDAPWLCWGTLQENSFWPLVPSSLTVLLTDGSNLALETNLEASLHSKTKFEPPVSNPGWLPGLWWMVLVLCWRQQLEQRLLWQRHAWPGWVRYQQNEATNVFVLDEFLSDVEHAWANPSTTQRRWCLPSSAKVLGLCGQQGVTPGRQRDCTDLLYSSLDQLLEYTSGWELCFFIKAHVEALEGAACSSCGWVLFPGVTHGALMHGLWQLSGVILLEFSWNILVMEGTSRDILWSDSISFAEHWNQWAIKIPFSPVPLPYFPRSRISRRGYPTYITSRI